MFPESCSINSLVTKEEGAIIMVDGSACEAIDTGTVNVTERDGTVRALKAVRYVLEARYNLISSGVLDEKRCQIQVTASSQLAKKIW